MYVKRDFLLIFYTVQPQNFDLLGTVEQPLIQVVVLKSNATMVTRYDVASNTCSQTIFSNFFHYIKFPIFSTKIIGNV